MVYVCNISLDGGHLSWLLYVAVNSDVQAPLASDLEPAAGVTAAENREAKPQIQRQSLVPAVHPGRRLEETKERREETVADPCHTVGWNRSDVSDATPVISLSPPQADAMLSVLFNEKKIWIWGSGCGVHTCHHGTLDADAGGRTPSQSGLHSKSLTDRQTDTQ